MESRRGTKPGDGGELHEIASVEVRELFGILIGEAEPSDPFPAHFIHLFCELDYSLVAASKIVQFP